MSRLSDQELYEFESELRTVKPKCSHLKTDTEWAKTLFECGRKFESSRQRDKGFNLRLQSWQYLAAACLLVGLICVSIFLWQKNSTNTPDESGVAMNSVEQVNKDFMSHPLKPSVEKTTRIAFVPEFEIEHVNHQQYELNQGLFAVAWQNRFRSNGAERLARSTNIQEVSAQNLRRELTMRFADRQPE